MIRSAAKFVCYSLLAAAFMAALYVCAPDAARAQAPTATPTPIPRLALEAVGTPASVGGTDGEVEVSWLPVPGLTYELEYRLETADAWTTGTISGESWTLSNAGGAGTTYIVRARGGDGTTDAIWSETTVTVPDVRVLGARVWYDVVSEGDMLLLGEYFVSAHGDDRGLVHTMYAGLQDEGAARLYPYWQSNDYGDGCEGFLSTTRPCPEPDGQGRGLFSVYFRVAPTTDPLPPVQLSSSRLWTFTSTLAPATGTGAADLRDTLRDALLRVGGEWDADLLLGDELTEIGTAYLLGLLPSAESFPLGGLLPAVEVQPEATRTPLPTPDAPTVDTGEIGERADEIAAETGMTVGVVFSLLTVVAIVGLVMYGRRYARIATAGSIAFALLVPFAIGLGWLGVEGVQAIAMLGAYGILRRLRRDLPSG